MHAVDREHFDDVRMLERGRGLDLALEAAARGQVRQRPVADPLDGDDAPVPLWRAR